ncbi:hypothetical protein ACFE04_021758 [Oxalis oulophora]
MYALLIVRSCLWRAYQAPIEELSDRLARRMWIKGPCNNSSSCHDYNSEHIYASSTSPLAMAAHQICLQVWLSVSLLADAEATSGQVSTLKMQQRSLQICSVTKPETMNMVCDIIKEQLPLEKNLTVTGASKFSELGPDSLHTLIKQLLSVEPTMRPTAKEIRFKAQIARCSDIQCVEQHDFLENKETLILTWSSSPKRRGNREPEVSEVDCALGVKMELDYLEDSFHKSEQLKTTVMAR